MTLNATGFAPDEQPGGIGGLGLDTRIPLLLVKIVEPVRIPAGA
ncbi:hypothetical protein [Streptomyces sp. gb1(2016)]|nr:hypothetical protein [Streptomyces sp. gb1(2016)]